MKNIVAAALGLAAGLNGSGVSGVVLTGWTLQVYDNSNCTSSTNSSFFIPKEFCFGSATSLAGNLGGLAGVSTFVRTSVEIEYKVETTGVTVSTNVYAGEKCQGNPVVKIESGVSVFWEDAIESCAPFQGKYIKAVEGSADTKDFYTKLEAKGKSCADVQGKKLHEIIDSFDFSATSTATFETALGSAYGDLSIMKGTCKATFTGSSSYVVGEGGSIQWYSTGDCSGSPTDNKSNCLEENDSSTGKKKSTVVGPSDEVYESSGNNNPDDGNHGTALVSSVVLVLASLSSLFL